MPKSKPKSPTLDLTVPIALVREPPTALRGPQVLDASYIELRDSVRERGVLVPILVRPGPRGSFVLIDGVQRLSLAKAAGLEVIPARVLDVTEEEALPLQIIANLHRVPTSPVQYSAHLHQMLRRDPKLTIVRLAATLDKSRSWLYSILNLADLAPEVAAMVDAGDISVANAAALSRLPRDAQVDYAPLAAELTPPEFIPKIAEVARRFKEGRRKGPKSPNEFVHVDFLQKIRDIKAEINGGAAARALIAECKPPDLPSAFRLGLEWALHRDPFSVRDAKLREGAFHAKRRARDVDLEAEAEDRRRVDLFHGVGAEGGPPT